MRYSQMKWTLLVQINDACAEFQVLSEQRPGEAIDYSVCTPFPPIDRIKIAASYLRL